jgi:hypothetical protein
MLAFTTFRFVHSPFTLLNMSLSLQRFMITTNFSYLHLSSLLFDSQSRHTCLGILAGTCTLSHFGFRPRSVREYTLMTLRCSRTTTLRQLPQAG